MRPNSKFTNDASGRISLCMRNGWEAAALVSVALALVGVSLSQFVWSGGARQSVPQGFAACLNARGAAFSKSAAASAGVLVADSSQPEPAKRICGILNADCGITCRLVTPAQIDAGILSSLAVLVVPGGSGKQQAAALGSRGRTAIRQFVGGGGGYVGICGGAFLATSGYDWSLALVNARTLTGTRNVHGSEIPLAARGTGMVGIELTDIGAELFPEVRKTVNVRYSSGPIFLSGHRADLPDFASIALFRTEISAHECQRGTMINTPAIIASMYGRGRVLLFSPHPEATSALQPFLVAAIWSVGRRQADEPDGKRSECTAPSAFHCRAARGPPPVIPRCPVVSTFP